MKLKADVFEWVFVSVFLVFLGYISVGAFLNHSVVHPYPYGFSASDAFGEVAFAEGVIETGSYKIIPPYIRGGFESIGFHMPIFYHVVANFSLMAGIPVWDADIMLGILFSLLVVLMMYLMIREYNKHVALLSLPLSVFMYVGSFKIIYTWGVWDFVLGSALMLGSMWVLSKLEAPLMWVILGILSSGVALSHITEAFFFGLFAIVYLGVMFAKEKLSFTYAKRLVWGGLLSLALSFYYLIIFKYGYGRGGSEWSIAYQAPEWYDVTFSHFGWVRFVVLLGVGAWLLVMLSKKDNVALLVAPFLFVVGYLNFTPALASRAFQTRYLWPVYLSLFLGLCLFMALRSVIKEWKLWQSISISVMMALLIITQFYEKPQTGSLMDAEHWQLFGWVKSNTLSNERLLYFYGDPYTQEAILWLQKRLSYRINLQDLVDAIQARKIKRFYEMEVAAADDAGWMYRKGLFSFGYHAEEIPDRSMFFGLSDICTFDYLVFDRTGSQQVLTQYNMLVANQLLNASSEVAFVNEKTVVIKNTKRGGDCIEERDI
jgi:hypothetical protein